ncbi:MAG: hypothetical protein JO307_24050, partial [Bryobacterales bacterium]|nr:hypothetical protein [Bryobacterales bacterium]
MSVRGRKIFQRILIALGSLLVVLIVAGIFIARSGWFRDFVRSRIVAAVEDSTGGRAEIGAFLFDWSHFRAEIRDFVLHGTEPPGAAPLFRASDITVQLRASSLWKRRRVELQSLSLQQPQANVIVFPDGRTNIPEPRIPRQTNKTGLETVVDLEIGRFQIDNGTIRFANQEMALSASGQNLNAQLFYETAADRYRGHISMNPLFLQSGSN